MSTITIEDFKNHENMLKVLDKLENVIKKCKETEWLNTPSEELNDNTPFEIISRDSEGLQEVLDLLSRIEWGIPT